jgi:tetratricopeptide (TPR) repeat protein
MLLKFIKDLQIMAVDKNKKKSLDAEITDALLDDFDKFEHFATTYWKHIAGLAAAVVVGVALYVIITDTRAASKRKINDAICNAKTEAEITEILKKYPEYPAANYARLRLAKSYLKEKKYDKAYEQFNILNKSDIPREMAWRIGLDEAYALELEGKKDAAAAKFAAIGSDSAFPDTLRREANYSAGRIYAGLKQNDKAYKYLEKACMGKASVNNVWTIHAKFLLIRIGRPVSKAAMVGESAESLKKGK